jgi:hypothetical protein
MGKVLVNMESLGVFLGLWHQSLRGVQQGLNGCLATGGPVQWLHQPSWSSMSLGGGVGGPYTNLSAKQEWKDEAQSPPHRQTRTGPPIELQLATVLSLARTRAREPLGAAQSGMPAITSISTI